jgi:multidrug efflux pump subunit AcrA (membrane-fusion protein)
MDLSMNWMRRRRLAAAVGVAIVAAVVAVRADDAPPRTSAATPAPVDAAIEPAISRPSEEAKLAFAGPGLISQVLVKEGDAVKAGQVLSQQDDRQEQVALASDKLDAESTAEIEYEKLDVELKQRQAKRKRDLYAMPGQNISLSEVEEAENAVSLSEAQLKVAQLHHDQKVLDYQKQKVKVEQMQLHSTVDGTVQKVIAHAGEMADPQNKDGALVVVRNDPLWVEIHPAADRALKLKVGQELLVRYTAPFGAPANPWMPANIWYFAPEADAGSKTEEVRLELANPGGQRSGLAMEVKLPADVAAVAVGGASGPADMALPPLGN